MQYVIEENNKIANELNKYKSYMMDIEELKNLEMLEKEIEDDNSKFTELSNINLFKLQRI